MEVPRTSTCWRRYSFACFSDQKKTDFRQNASMMLGSSSALKFTIGTNTSGFALESDMEKFSLLSISIWIFFPQ
jgi:hypothetical protein